MSATTDFFPPLFPLFQRTKATIKIFSDPMPGSNERSVQLIGSNAQIIECVQHFLDDISKVGGLTPAR